MQKLRDAECLARSAKGYMNSAISLLRGIRVLNDQWRNETIGMLMAAADTVELARSRLQIAHRNASGSAGDSDCCNTKEGE